MTLLKLDANYNDLRGVVRDFAEKEVAPRAREVDRAGVYPRELFEAMRDASLLGLPIPEQYGGMGAGMTGLCVAIEEVTRYCQSAGLILLLSRLAGGPILLSGNEDQRARYLPGITSGQLRGSFCLTEPHAGSDTSAIATRARETAGGFVLDGRKSYISGATVADFYIVWARAEGEPGGRNLAGFIVDRDLSGVSIGHVDDKMGVRGVPTAEIVLESVKIPADARLTPPGKGFAHLMAALNSARPGVAARALGLTSGALSYAVEYARQRHVFGQPLIEMQNVQFVAADLATHLEAARALVYGTAQMVDEGSYDKHAAPYIAMAKYFAADLAVRASSECLQILGAAGYMTDHPMERYYRDAKQLQIVEGTSEIQKLIIGRAVRDSQVTLG
jgi:alkylation response protein AidB-like acyl-CoA dehydrogenase